ncbi:MAG: hypothetical protein EB120_12380 [Proteobacteria bacterium]|nr:hypothetical protein [Pseudomonadota bacterium]
MSDTKTPPKQEKIDAKPQEEAKPVAAAQKPSPAPAKVEAPPQPVIVQPKTDNLLKRINLTVLYPRFAELVEQLVANCRARGADYYAISGERTWEEQAKIWAQGRSTPGPIVTKSQPGTSPHNYAIAVDFCHDKDKQREGLQPDWNLESYRILGEEAQKLGLESGFWWTKFVDAPHVQLPLSKVGLRIADLRAAYNAGGKSAVFRLLNKYNW